MIDPHDVRRAIFRLAVLTLISSLLTACASTEDPLKQKRHTERKWYQSDMDNSDRTFFLDTFFSNGR